MKTKSFFFLQLALFLAVFFPKALFSFPITPPNILPSSHYRNDPQTMYPYIHGDLFRAYSDFVIDEGLQPIDPEKVKKGDIIFLRAEWLDFFFSKVHPLIKEKYILLTHNEFNNVDLPGKWVCYLDEQKLAGWFGKSLGIPNHLKAFPLPLGIKNVPRRYQEQPLEKDKQRLLFPLKKAMLNLPTPKVNLLYINFSLCTEERVDVMHFFKKKPFIYFAEKLCFSDYLTDIAKSKFVLSPRGTCEDCYRTWESLLLGSIPIIKSSFLDRLFTDLPVLIVKEWEEITEEFLQNQYLEIQSKTYKKEKLFIDYWLEKLLHYQKLVVKDQEFSFSYD